MTTVKICSVSSCERRVKAKTYCSLHYKRYRKYGSTSLPVRSIIVGCVVDGCSNKHFARGYCCKHYTRIIRYGDPNTVFLKKRKSETGFCSVEGCENKHKAKGYCRKHYLRVYKHGTLDAKRVIHGLSDHPLYHVWSSIKDRCLNPNCHAYANYGGRGIKICERWKNSFPDFLSDVGDRPMDGLSIDRINNDGNYEPGNVRWADWSLQTKNRRFGSMSRGSHRYNTELTEDDVMKMRKMHDAGMVQRKIAEMFGVTPQTVNGILRYRSWKHVA